MAEFIYAIFIVIMMILTGKFLFGERKCKHQWVRYTIQKSLASPRQKCVICELCGKSYIKEVGLEVVEEGWFVSRHIDIDQLWKTAKNPYEGSIEQMFNKHGMKPLVDEEVNPELERRHNG